MCSTTPCSVVYTRIIIIFPTVQLYSVCSFNNSFARVGGAVDVTIMVALVLLDKHCYDERATPVKMSNTRSVL